MPDQYANRSASTLAPANHAFAISPDDDADLEEMVRALYVGGVGDLAVVMKSGASVTFAGVPSGSIVPVRVSRVLATDTSASAIVGLV